MTRALGRDDEAEEIAKERDERLHRRDSILSCMQLGIQYAKQSDAGTVLAGLVVDHGLAREAAIVAPVVRLPERPTRDMSFEEEEEQAEKKSARDMSFDEDSKRDMSFDEEPGPSREMEF